MSQKVRFTLILCISGLFVFCDQIFKYLARSDKEMSWYLYKPWLGWEYFSNLGVAFNLPVPPLILFILTPLILITLILFLKKKWPLSAYSLWGGALVVGGALSNFFDRIFLGITVDYIRIFTAVINIADIMILVGGILLIKNFSFTETITKKNTK